jgi:hypothetical protein
MNGIAAPAPFRLNIGAIPALHRQMAFACAAILAVSLASGSMTSIRILSTMTTGWHYFVCVLAGCTLALVVIADARALPARTTVQSHCEAQTA